MKQNTKNLIFHALIYRYLYTHLSIDSLTIDLQCKYSFFLCVLNGKISFSCIFSQTRTSYILNNDATFQTVFQFFNGVFFSLLTICLDCVFKWNAKNLSLFRLNFNAKSNVALAIVAQGGLMQC